MAPSSFSQKKNKADKVDKKPLAIRPTVPMSIEHFANSLYSSHHSKRLKYEQEAARILGVLGHLALSSSIKDTFRRDPCRLELQNQVKAVRQGGKKVHPTATERYQDKNGPPLLCNKLLKSLSVSQLDKELATTNAKGDPMGISRGPPKKTSHSAGQPHYQRHDLDSVVQQTRQCSSQARRSFLALATAMIEPLPYGNKTRPTTMQTDPMDELQKEADIRIRVKALEYLQEALDTNELAQDEAEVASLFLLAGRIKDVLTTYHHSFFVEFNSLLKRRAALVQQPPPNNDSNATTLATADMTLPSSSRLGTAQEASSRVTTGSQLNSVRITSSSNTQENNQADNLSDEQVQVEENDITNDLASLIPPMYDIFTEKLLNCLSLTLQRLEYAQELKRYAVPSDVEYVMNQLQRLLNAFVCIGTNNAYISHLLSFMIESASISSILSPPIEDEERMAGTVAVSILARVMKMAPAKKLAEYYSSFSDILTDLYHRSEWHMGIKFIKLIATAASKQYEACDMFVKVLVNTTHLRWEWTHQGIQCLTVIAVSGETSMIRKIALEKGLLRFAEMNSVQGTPNKNDWRIRVSAMMALASVCKELKGTSMSLVAQETIASQLQSEQDQRVIQSIYSFATSHSHILPEDEIQMDRASLCRLVVSDDSTNSRPSYLFKYVSIHLAENYLETRNRHKILRKYLQSAQRGGSRYQLKLQEKFKDDWEKMKGLLKAYEETSGVETKIKEKHKAHPAPKLDLSSIKKPVIPIPMNLDYHHNYEIAKLFQDKQDEEYEQQVREFAKREAESKHSQRAAASYLDEDDIRNEDGSEEQGLDDFDSAFRKNKVEPLKISLLASKHYNVPEPDWARQHRPSSVKKPGRGTMNRRKLLGNPSQHAPVKIRPCAPQDVVSKASQETISPDLQPHFLVTNTKGKYFYLFSFLETSPPIILPKIIPDNK